MKGVVSSFASGVLFAVGLGVSGMTKPSKVVGFLDLFGAWDASLAFVMMGAIAVHLVAQRLITRRPAPLFDARFHLPSRKDLDARLMLGAALFGIGWGIGGFCPGPGLVAAASGAWPALVFVLGMIIGIKLEHFAARALAGTALILLVAAPDARAADWPIVQGTERPDAPAVRPFGVVQGIVDGIVSDPVEGLGPRTEGRVSYYVLAEVGSEPPARSRRWPSTTYHRARPDPGHVREALALRPRRRCRHEAHRIAAQRIARTIGDRLAAQVTLAF